MPATDYIGKVSEIGHVVAESDLSPTEVHRGFYYFLSLDLVGATEFKVRHPDQWLEIFAEFYEVAANNVGQRISDLQLWKFAGDEVLFYGQLVGSVETLVRVVEDSHVALHEILETLTANRPSYWHKGALAKGQAGSEKRLSIKATAWSAAVMDTAGQSAGVDAVPLVPNRVVTTAYEDQQGIDFLGPEVDAGFRLGKLTWAGILLVSAEIACLLWKHGPGPASNRLRIVGYEQLKGVWGARYYPAVWYLPDWSLVPDLFEYDDRFVSPQVKNAVSDGEKIDRLEKVFADADKLAVVEQMRELLVRPKGQSLSQLHQSRLEVHVVAVCVNDQDEVLLARRSATKTVLPGKWEFGCGRLTINDDFQRCVEREYRADFGIEVIELLPNPIGSYVLAPPAKPARVPGVLFAVLARGTPTARPDKHDDVQWMSLAKMESDIATGDAVPELHRLAGRAVHEVETVRAAAISGLPPPIEPT